MADETRKNDGKDNGESKTPKLASPAEKHKQAQADVDRLHEEHQDPSRPVG